jgi:phosphoglycolate phosphatase-like HAD superfamily hydrolase
MIALDFDGVMMNSSIEIAVTAARSLGLSSVESIEALPDNYLELFRSNHCRASRAGDMIVLGRWALETANKPPSSMLSEVEFAQLVSTDPLPLNDREKLFFSTRMQFIESSKETWLSLNTPYEPLWQAILGYTDKPLTIITRKNKAAVIELCAHFGLVIPAERIYAGDDGTPKSEHLENVMSEFPTAQFLFVDDSLHNLLELQKSHGHRKTIELAFALWGFVTPEEPEQAKKQGLSCLTQEQLISRMSAE